MLISLELIERFHEKWVLDEETGCWNWIGALMGNGYGQIKIPGTRHQVSAHRLSYAIHRETFDSRLQVCHHCDNTKCVKPSHLFLGTQKDNLQDMKKKDRHLHGSRNARSKLTESQVRDIHKLFSDGLSQGKIARTVGVSQGQIWRILNGKQWEKIYREINSGHKE